MVQYADTSDIGFLRTVSSVKGVPVSGDNEKNADDFDFDFNSFADEDTKTPQDDAQGNDAQNDGEFFGIAPETSDITEDSAGPREGLSLEKGTVEVGAESPADSTFESTAEGGLNDIDASEDISPEEDSEKPPEEESDTAFPPIISSEEESGKKGKKKKKEKPKKEKKSKEKSPKAPIELGWILALLLLLVLLGALIAHTIFTYMNPPKDAGFNSTIYYLAGVWVFGLAAVFVPLGFLFSKVKADIYKVALGASTIAVAFGAILLLAELYTYDFQMKPATAVPSVSMPSIEPAPDVL